MSNKYNYFSDIESDNDIQGARDKFVKTLFVIIYKYFNQFFEIRFVSCTLILIDFKYKN